MYTYSFLDVSVIILHPVIGAFTSTGEGLGELTVTMTTERTAQDIAADGSIMVSKVAGNNGQIAINTQQTSILYKWLVDAYNISWQSATSLWAGMSVLIRSADDGTSHLCTGVSFNKLPDKVYQAHGQKVTFTLPCADIQTMTA